MNRDDRDVIQLIGVVLVIIGLGIWGVYVVERYLLNMNVTDREFLPYHLMTVIPGMILWQHRFIRGIIKRMFRGK